MRIAGVSIPPPPDPVQMQYALGGLNVFVGSWLLIRTLSGKKCPRWYLYFSAASGILAGALQIKAARDLAAQPRRVAPAPTPTTVTAAIATPQPVALTGGR